MQLSEMHGVERVKKKHIIKKSRNSKLKETYYINEKAHLATEKKILYFIIP